MENNTRRSQSEVVERFLARLSALQCIKWFVITVLSIKFIQFIFNDYVLIKTIDSHPKAPFKLFISVHTLLIIIQWVLFYLKHRDYFIVSRLPDIQENGELSLFGNFVDAFSLFWSLTGLHWTQECKTCRLTAPLLYYTTLFWSYYGIFVVIAPLFAIILLIFILAYFKPDLPIIDYKANCGIPPESAQCSICLTDYTENDKVKILPCKHHFHCTCVDEWFIIDDICPLCKKPINILYDFID